MFSLDYPEWGEAESPSPAFFVTLTKPLGAFVGFVLTCPQAFRPAPLAIKTEARAQRGDGDGLTLGKCVDGRPAPSSSAAGWHAEVCAVGEYSGPPLGSRWPGLSVRTSDSECVCVCGPGSREVTTRHFLPDELCSGDSAWSLCWQEWMHWRCLPVLSGATNQ